jgi:hypothetical protein
MAFVVKSNVLLNCEPGGSASNETCARCRCNLTLKDLLRLGIRAPKVSLHFRHSTVDGVALHTFTTWYSCSLVLCKKYRNILGNHHDAKMFDIRDKSKTLTVLYHYHWVYCKYIVIFPVVAMGDSKYK